MDSNRNSDNLQSISNKIDIWINKWLFLLIILTPYFYFSYKTIAILCYSKPLTDQGEFECGTGLFASILGHFVLAAIVALILTIYFIFKNNYPFWLKLSLLMIVLALPFISYSAFWKYSRLKTQENNPLSASCPMSDFARFRDWIWVNADEFIQIVTFRTTTNSVS